MKHTNMLHALPVQHDMLEGQAAAIRKEAQLQYDRSCLRRMEGVIPNTPTADSYKAGSFERGRMDCEGKELLFFLKQNGDLDAAYSTISGIAACNREIGGVAALSEAVRFCSGDVDSRVREKRQRETAATCRIFQKKVRKATPKQKKRKITRGGKDSPHADKKRAPR